MHGRSLAALAAWLTLAGPAAAQPPLDPLGDPLPPGAVARLGTTRLAFRGATTMQSAFFSPDGKTIFARDAQAQSVVLWDAVTGKERRRLAEGFVAYEAGVALS